MNRDSMGKSVIRASDFASFVALACHDLERYPYDDDDRRQPPQ
jgi:hypothetical protein